MLKKIGVSNHFITSILIILFLVFLYFVFDLFLYDRLNDNQIKEQGKLFSKELSINFEIFLKEIDGVADEISDNIASGEVDKNNLVEELERTLKFEYDLSSIGVLFAPYSYDKTLRLYSPYIVKDDKGTKQTSFDSFYDYTTQSVPWYEESIQGEGIWTKPFYDEISREELIYYTKTIEMPLENGNVTTGLLFIGISILDIRDKLSSLNIEYLDQPYILTTDGHFIVQPSDIKMRNLASPHDIDSKSMDFIKTKDGKTNEYIYQFFTALKSNDWIIVFDLLETEVIENYSLYRIKIINIVISLIILLTALGFYFLKRITHNYESAYIFWYLSIPLFMIYLLGSVYICYLGLAYQDKSEKEQYAILNESILEDFKVKYIGESLENKDEPPFFIPTGIFIESIDFNTSGSVNIKGIIWQKYYNKLHDGISRNVSISNANDQNLTKFFEKTFDQYTLIEWQFNINLSSNFAYSKYPFSNENLWLQLKHQEFDKNIVLVPDLESYKQVSSRYVPGLDKNIKIRNWAIKNSFFSYTFDSYNTNFGINNFIGETNFPEIYFNIIMVPNILNVFISNFLPIIIALILMYAIFKTATGHYVVRPYATLFLALIFLQISLRSNLGANEIVYIEYYYFLTYFIMVGISLNVVVLQNSNLGIVKYKNNLIPKLLFWPFTGLAILILNIFVFFN